MKYLSVSLLARCSLVIITLGFIAGCGGSQPAIGVPGAMPQAPAIPPARTMLHHIGIASSSYDVLHSFGKRHDGGTPYASLLDVNGTLYGTTSQGGEYGDGTVFSVTTTGTEHVLHSFGGGQDGSGPYASLLDLNGTLFGTTGSGGTYSFGTVFSITTTGTEHVLHSFGGGYDGNGPDASLLSLNGTLFGTTSRGGRYGLGTVFSITVAGVERRLHNFRFRSDGAYPEANLIEVNGTLYSTTSEGGTYNGGTVFSITTAGVEHVLHSFSGGLYGGSDGLVPAMGVIDVNGTLYGTTVGGGTHNGGTVFSITTAGVEHVLYSFTGGHYDGETPRAGLIDVNGTLYGTTVGGGKSLGYGRGPSGTVFTITTAGTEEVVHKFGRGQREGEYPYASLIDVNGTLYGTTAGGGAHTGCHFGGCGTVFALTP